MKETAQKKEYIKPELDIVPLEPVDVLTTSVGVKIRSTKKQTAFISPWSNHA